MASITFIDQNVTTEVEFLDNPTADKIKASLPLCATANIWGDEIYFDTGIDAPAREGTLDVDVGDVAYWPQGKCLCIFFGPTPVSGGDKPVPASEVVIVGRTGTSPEELRGIPSGANIIME